jgi:hypothetical protein
MTKEQYIKYFGLEKCNFDDDCDFCDKPQGGVWAKITTAWETETEYYICGECIDEKAKEFDKQKYEQQFDTPSCPRAGGET